MEKYLESVKTADLTLASQVWLQSAEGLPRAEPATRQSRDPLAHITNAEIDPDNVGRWWHGWKLLGTDVPGLFAAGTFYYHGELVFWDVRDPAKTIIVSLDHERYKKLILEVADPEGVVTRLRTWLRK